MYDLIHIRHVLPVIRNVSGLLASTWEHLEPGGWLEVQEFSGELLCDDGTVPAHSALKKFFVWLGIAIGKFDMSFGVTNEFAGMCEDMGFKNISVNVIKTPLGMWPSAEVCSFVILWIVSATVTRRWTNTYTRSYRTRHLDWWALICNSLLLILLTPWRCAC